MNSDNKIVYLDQIKQRQPGAIQEVYDRLRQLGVKRLVALLQHMLERADDTLFDRAGQGEAGADRSEYFDAMRQVRLKRRELEEGFQREILAQFRSLSSRLPRRAEQPGAGGERAELALVDDAVLELELAVEGMVGKARARAEMARSQLQIRLDYLLSDRDVNGDNNPFDPAQVCRAFQNAAEILELGLEARLIMLKLFERYVLSELPGLYEEANQVLIELGVLPELKPGVEVSDDGGGARDASAEAAAGDGELVEVLHQLLAQRKSAGAGGRRWNGRGYGSAASAADVVAALSLLQQEETGADLKALLGRALQRHSGRAQALGPSEDDTIDIVAMLFDAILDDPNLAHPIKALLGRLQIPVLKVALLDREFFGNRQHPARLLINELAQAALGWMEPAQLELDPLYGKLEAIVARVLREFRDDVGLFALLLEEFRLFQEEERERVRQIEERTRQAAEGKAKVDRAKALVDAELAARLALYEPPEAVRTLLREGWSKVLFITALKEGEHSDAFRRLLGVVDRLLWSIEPKPAAAERKSLLREIPALLHDLREGLHSILFNPFEMTRLFKALEAEHIRCLTLSGRGEPQAAAPRADEALPGEAELLTPTAPVEPAQVDDTARVDDTQRRLTELPVGTWFEFVHGDDQRMRAKLSARLSGGRRLIFVNRAGFKLADKTVPALAAEIDAGRACILDDNMLFDKALEAVVSNLRDMRAGQ